MQKALQALIVEHLEPYHFISVYRQPISFQDPKHFISFNIMDIQARKTKKTWPYIGCPS